MLPLKITGGVASKRDSIFFFVFLQLYDFAWFMFFIPGVFLFVGGAFVGFGILGLRGWSVCRGGVFGVTK